MTSQESVKQNDESVKQDEGKIEVKEASVKKYKQFIQSTLNLY